MSNTLFFVMLFAEILYFALIILLIKNKTLSLRYTLLWLFAGFAMVFFTVFPDSFIFLIKFSGVETTMNGLFSLCIFFIFILLISLSGIVSKQSDTIRQLVQDNAILEKRIRDLENNNSKNL